MFDPNHIVEIINLDAVIEGEHQYCRVIIDLEDTSSASKFYRITDGQWMEISHSAYRDASFSLKPYLPKSYPAF